MAIAQSIRNRLRSFLTPGWDTLQAQKTNGNTPAAQADKSSADAILDLLHGTGTSATIWRSVSDHLKVDMTRRGRYEDYSVMERMIIVGTALGVYADETTQPHVVTHKNVWFEGDKEAVKVAQELTDRLDLETIIPAIARSIAKNGDHFEGVNYDPDNPKNGVTSMQGVENPIEVDRLEKEGILVSYLLTAGESKEYSKSMRYKESPSNRIEGVSKDLAIANPWDYVHFRRLGRHRAKSFGESVLENARPAYKILKILMESLAVYRVARAPERNIFEVDIGSMTPEQGWEHINRYRKSFRQRTHVDQITKKMSIDNHPLAWDTDVFVPIRGQSTNNISRTAGGANISDIVDIELYRGDFFAGLSIPPEYLGARAETSGIYRPSQLLAKQDIRFAHAARRLQQSVIAGLKRLIMIEFALKELKFGPKDFDVVMTVISSQDESERLEILNSKLASAQVFSQVLADMAIPAEDFKIYILQQVLGLPIEDIELMKLNPSKDYSVSKISNELIKKPKRMEYFQELLDEVRGDLFDQRPCDEMAIASPQLLLESERPF